MTDPSRRIAFDILKAVESEGAFSNILLNRKLQTAEGADAAWSPDKYPLSSLDFYRQQGYVVCGEAVEGDTFRCIRMEKAIG